MEETNDVLVVSVTVLLLVGRRQLLPELLLTTLAEVVLPVPARFSRGVSSRWLWFAGLNRGWAKLFGCCFRQNITYFPVNAIVRKYHREIVYFFLGTQ